MTLGRSFLRRLWLAMLPALVTSAVLFQAPAVAAVACDFDFFDTLTISFDGSLVVTTAEPGDDGSDLILVGPTFEDLEPCRAPVSETRARVTTVRRIDIVGSAGDDYLIVAEGAGPFEPGAGAEDSGPEAPLREIEFVISLGEGLDVFDLEGDAAPDRFTYGEGGGGNSIALNGDNDAEMQVFGIDVLSAFGRDGNDRLQALGGHGTGSALQDPAVFLDGNAGDDTLFGGLDDDGLVGGPGRDTLHGSGGADSVNGSDGTDLSQGGSGDDFLINESGRDTFVPGPDNDRVHGDPGSRDTVDYSGVGAPMVVNLQTGEAVGDGTDTLDSIENVIGSRFGDTIDGNAAQNTLDGGNGDDTVRAFEDNDSIAPGAGADQVFGGLGTDSVNYQTLSRDVTVNLRNGEAVETSRDTLAGFENAIGTEFSDRLIGTDDLNRLVGLGRDDDLFGLGAADLLEGFDGDDDLDGGPGTDSCFQGAGTGILTDCENVGTFTVKPRAAVVEPGERIAYGVTWTHPRRWRRLDTVEIRFRAGDDVLAWVRWNEEGNTFQLFHPASRSPGEAAEGGGSGTLGSPFAVLHLRGSDAEALDPKTILVTFDLAFRRAAAGDLAVDVTAQDDRNNRMAWEGAGTLKVTRA